MVQRIFALHYGYTIDTLHYGCVTCGPLQCIYVSASHLKEGVLGLRVPLGNDMFGLIDGAPDVVLCGSESDGKAMISTK